MDGLSIMAYTVAWERHGAYIRYSDVVDFHDFMDAVLGIHADANYATIKYVIHDMLGASRIDFSAVDMTQLVAHELGARYTNPHVRPVIVSTDTLMQQMVRAFYDHTKLQVGLCPTLAEARTWVERASSFA